MKNAGGIVRVSTERQLDNTSPETQKLEISKVSKAQGYHIDEQNMWVVAESGASKDRAGFHLALDAAEKGLIDRVYVHKVDRLGRDVLEMLSFLDKLKRLNVDCFIVESGKLADAEDLVLLIEAAVASDERRRIQNRTYAGLKSVVRDGKYGGGIVTYGYKINPTTKRYEEDEEDAAIVRSIFDCCVNERLSTIKISDKLNGLNIPTRYTKDGRGIRGEKTQGIWRPGRVLQILKNPTYTGVDTWGKRSNKTNNEKISRKIPPIIDQAVFDAAQEVLKGNMIISSRNAKHEYLLRGLIRCSTCGLTYTGYHSKTADGETTYYRCNGSTKNKNIGPTRRCQAKGIRVDVIEKIVWDHVTEFVRHPQLIIEAAHRWSKKMDIDKIHESIERAEKAIIEFGRQEKRLLHLHLNSTELDAEAYDAGMRDIKRRKAQALAEKNNQQARLERVAGAERIAEEIAARLEKLDSVISSMDFQQCQELVNELVVKIVIGELPYQDANGEWTRDIHITYRHEEILHHLETTIIDELNGNTDHGNAVL